MAQVGTYEVKRATAKPKNGAPGIIAGVGLVVLWLVSWRLLFNAADWFGPVAALMGMLTRFCALLLAKKLADKQATLVRGLSLAGWVWLGLAVASAISLGAFLPTGLAEWVSPVLGKWGGALTFLIITLGLAATLLLRLSRRFLLLAHLITGSLLSSLYISIQNANQLKFPTPPTDPDSLQAGAGVVMLVEILLLDMLGPLLLGWLIGRWRGWINREKNIAGWGMMRWLWGWAGGLTVWSLAADLLWTVIGGLRWDYLSWYWLGLVGLLLIIGALIWRWSWPWQGGPLWRAILGRAGWLLLGLTAALLVYFGTTEDLEAVMLRNTAEYRLQQVWRSAFGDERFAERPSGAFSGQVWDASQGDANAKPEPNATVVLASVAGQTYSATADGNGRYRVEGVPEGNYVPLAYSRGGQAHRNGPLGSAVVTIKPGQTTEGVDFRAVFVTTHYHGRERDDLQLGEATTVSRDNPEPSQALRRPFTIDTDFVKLKGLVHEPPASAGPGPFPVLLIIYPGPAESWESVSIPLAAKGYVVVSYYPDTRLLDLEGTLHDLQVIHDFVTKGEFSQRSDSKRIGLVGGSVSTAFTYLMAEDVATSAEPGQPPYRALVQYGGLSDLYRFRYTWERGQVVIDPGISELEYLLVAFGRPDTRPELWLRFSPEFRLRPGQLPPTLLVHVQKDIIVPVEQTQRADALLKRLGTPDKVIIYPELEHYLDLSKRDPAYEDMLNQTISFLQDTLK